ncbi:hypothetical protein V4C53_35535 [Paraburkholderia azotifigens]|uniref:hypothetical protein n=1 Tax=Paraburkholderia azotifigens TaxID=2057004 RepID=UPI0031709ABB
MNEKEIRASMTSEQILLERKLTCEAINGAIAFGYLNTNPPPSDDHWLAPFWKIGRERGELEAKVATPAAVAPAVDARYIVIGYGETDYPDAVFVNDREQLLDAVLGMMYTTPADADDEIREAYRKDLADDDEWCVKVWRTEFEIGGITIYDTGERAALSARASDAAAGEPMAWARPDLPERLSSPIAYSAVTELLKNPKDGYIPLYTHPACEPKAALTLSTETVDNPVHTSGMRGDPVEAFLAEVRAELIRARTKFPGDRIMTIALAEEFGELCKAVLDESAANVRKEAVQTAVMCARVALDGDGSVNDWRAERGLDPLVLRESEQFSHD